MADQTITPAELTLNAVTEIADGSYEDLTAANDGVCTIPDDGAYLFHFIDAAGGAVVTITHGDGILSAQGDVDSAAMTINLHNFAVIESSRIKWLAGTDKGKVRISTTADIKAACIKLPNPR